MKRFAATAALILSSAIGHAAYSRGIPLLTYDELFAKSDFVVIAKPITNTRDTSERKLLGPLSPPVPVIGVVTDFESLLVLKGTKPRRFMLHHYREVRPKFMVDGLNLIEFHPNKSQRQFYLLFLAREPNGRFAPVAGQDWVDISVQELSGNPQ
jgi:hypothetical protein